MLVPIMDLDSKAEISKFTHRYGTIVEVLKPVDCVHTGINIISVIHRVSDFT